MAAERDEDSGDGGAGGPSGSLTQLLPAFLVPLSLLVFQPKQLELGFLVLAGAMRAGSASIPAAGVIRLPP